MAIKPRIDGLTAHDFKTAAAEGLTMIEAAEKLGASVSTVSRAKKSLGLTFAIRPANSADALLDGLTESQRLDAETYVKTLGLGIVAAVAKVTAPRRRVTCLPPDMRAATREARP